MYGCNSPELRQEDPAVKRALLKTSGPDNSDPGVTFHYTEGGNLVIRFVNEWPELEVREAYVKASHIPDLIQFLKDEWP